MEKKEIVDYLKRRWKRVKEREIEELKQTPFKVRFLQTSAMMQFANSLGWPERDKEEKIIRGYWKKLKNKVG